MEEKRQSIHGQWSSRTAFVLAATGSAVGLGNIWKFPYITGQNGGGAFVLVYLVCILIIGIPVMMGELLIGRRGRQSPSHSIAELAKEAGAPRAWSFIGFMGITASFLILTFYVVVAGWAVAYIFATASGTFVGISADAVGAYFGDFQANPWELILWSTVVTLGTAAIVAGGVRKGLERAVTWLMPGMLIILVLLVVYALNTGSFMEGFRFLFQPDFGKLSANGVLVALGHAFFTLSLASGVMIAYGAYLPEDTSIFQTSVIVAASDTAVALLAGLAIFPIVFAYGLDVGGGPGLIFATLPIAFGQMPFGQFFGTLFFIMLSLAAITSAISLLEPTVAWVVERFGTTRRRGVIITSVILWLLSLGTVFSFSTPSKATFFGRTFYDNLDYLTANIMLPAGGLLVAVFTAWIMKPESTRHELQLGESRIYSTWGFVMRYIAPIAILIVFLNAIGVLKFGGD